MNYIAALGMIGLAIGWLLYDIHMQKLQKKTEKEVRQWVDQ